MAAKYWINSNSGDYIFDDNDVITLCLISRYDEDELVKAKKEYTEKFKVGDRVYYKNNPGIITFKHSDKSELAPTKFSVQVKDTEFRYVCGLELVERKKQDLSDIEIDPNLNKLSTEKLLKMYRRQRGNRYIKRILEEREHVQREEQKTIIIK